MGACAKVAKALEQSDNAAKKAAALKEADDQAIAAAKQLAHETERNEQLRRQIEGMRGAFARRPPPRSLICPISTELLVDPVVAAVRRMSGRRYQDGSPTTTRRP